MPLGENFKSKSIGEPVMDRFSLWLESWKAALLSKGGRLTLLKSTLAFILNYYLSLFTILASVASCIEFKFCKFFIE